MSKKEEHALQNLCERDVIIVTKTDEGGAVVMADVDDYVQEANQQLHNKEFCCLRYKTIFCYKVALDGQLMNFFLLEEEVMFCFRNI